ncbi:DUF2953 domain-containing protein [Bacillus sp. FJAT-49711]|uniref:DUF2953 domain-containing protein n=1 Tax=Bacillus sp. FJAT-49711 TaxID=2833585 RepID=UPI001BC92D55|nr:DUF2953 domain-containing protein [Bacillus sp. FJAT-49711]MBS4216836.1 DUF2953 domain-containing protein [Bacillus sp. FJAT-49711]
MTLPILGGLFLLLLFLLFIFMKIKIDLLILLSKSESYLSVAIVTLFGLIRIKKKVKLNDLISEKAANEMKDHMHENVSMKMMLSDIHPFLHILKSFLLTMKIRKLEWHSTIGTGEAASSATAAGAIWAIKGALLSYVRSNLTFKNSPIISVVPDFQGFSAQTKMQCMVDIKTGKAMVAGINLYKEWKKYEKSSQIKGQNQKIDRRTING